MEEKSGFWIRTERCTNNIIHDSKCSGISIGKGEGNEDNDFSRYHIKPGYQYQLEEVFKNQNRGWSRERIGSHIIRNNTMYDCGQNAIVGHLGCIFSEIYGNEIYNIAVKHEFYGHEIAGIKLHAAIDVKIHHNYIHNCTLGTWLDWQAQGTRVSSNVYCDNNRDFMIEVTHGPCLVDNNIFASAYSFDNAAQGGAYVHNLCCGFTNHYPVLNRATPYHMPHSTEILGTALVYGADPEELWDMPTQMITTELLGTVRIVGARFENPDGSSLELDRDINGNARGAKPMAGPVEWASDGEREFYGERAFRGERAFQGKNRVKVWTKRAEDFRDASSAHTEE